MKCPNCNKEVSPEFNVCPWCGYKPKKCSKPEHQDLWLPVEARFCPRCGEPLSAFCGEKASWTRNNDNSLNKNLEFNVDGVSFTMIYVEGGTFMMGSPDSDSDAMDREKPQHRVTLNDYYIGETQVTQALWEAVMGGNPSNWKGDNLPVDNVSWEDGQEFCKQMNKKTGMAFHLPTEAEWEYAARGGRKNKGFKYAGSNDIDSVAWYIGNSGNEAHIVKQKSANELRLYDMSGNVWEWCQDWYGDYSSSDQTNPTGPSSSYGHVLRGGHWNIDARFCRVSLRVGNIPTNRYSFRLALVHNKGYKDTFF